MKTIFRRIRPRSSICPLLAIVLCTFAIQLAAAADPPAKKSAPPTDQPSAADPVVEQALGARLSQTPGGSIVVTHVRRGGPASRNGIRPGDQVVSVAGAPVSKLDDVRAALTQKPRGENLALVVRPSERKHQLRVAANAADGYEDAKTHPPAMLGVTLNNVGGKVTVVQLYAGSPADRADIRSGDIIRAVDGRKITSRKELFDLLSKKKPGNMVTLGIVSINGETPREVKVTLGSRGELLNHRLVTRPVVAPPPTERVIVGDDWIDANEAQEIDDPFERARDTDFDG